MGPSSGTQASGAQDGSAPSVARDVGAPEHAVHHHGDATAFEALPDAVLAHVASLLSPPSLQALYSTCSHTRRVSGQHVEGLVVQVPESEAEGQAAAGVAFVGAARTWAARSQGVRLALRGRESSGRKGGMAREERHCSSTDRPEHGLAAFLSHCPRQPGISVHDGVRQIILQGLHVSSHHTAALASWPQLTSLAVRGCTLHGDVFQVLHALPHLSSLEMSECNLERDDPDSFWFGRGALPEHATTARYSLGRHLATLTTLTHLHLSQSVYCSRALTESLHALPLSTAAPQLSTLSLFSAKDASPQFMAGLARVTALTRLTLSCYRDPLGDRHLWPLLSACSRLQRLHLYNGVTLGGLAALLAAPHPGLHVHVASLDSYRVESEIVQPAAAESLLGSLQIDYLPLGGAISGWLVAALPSLCKALVVDTVSVDFEVMAYLAEGRHELLTGLSAQAAALAQHWTDHGVGRGIVLQLEPATWKMGKGLVREALHERCVALCGTLTPLEPFISSLEPRLHGFWADLAPAISQHLGGRARGLRFTYVESAVAYINYLKAVATVEDMAVDTPEAAGTSVVAAAVGAAEQVDADGVLAAAQELVMPWHEERMWDVYDGGRRFKVDGIEMLVQLCVLKPRVTQLVQRVCVRNAVNEAEVWARAGAWADQLRAELDGAGLGHVSVIMGREGV